MVNSYLVYLPPPDHKANRIRPSPFSTKPNILFRNNILRINRPRISLKDINIIPLHTLKTSQIDRMNI